MSPRRGHIEEPAGAVTVEHRVHFTRSWRGRRRLQAGDRPPPRPKPVGRIPRVSRLVALAHRFEHLVVSGAVADQADIARLAGLSRARVTQIMNLLYLAPDVQEEVLHLPPTMSGRDAIRERQLRAIARIPEWSKQRQQWRAVIRAADDAGVVR